MTRHEQAKKGCAIVVSDDMEYGTPFMNGYNKGIEAGVKWADSHPNWHKYPEEKPPKPGKPVLCRTAKGTYVVAQQKEKLIGGKPSGQYHWSRWNAPIIAWMELPQPPKFE